jgi:hypothetical protein
MGRHRVWGGESPNSRVRCPEDSRLQFPGREMTVAAPGFSAVR